MTSCRFVQLRYPLGGVSTLLEPSAPRIRTTLDSPSALVEPKSPVWLQTGSADDASVVLADDLFRSWSTHEIQVETTTDSTVSDTVIPQEPILAVCVAGVDTMRGRRRIVSAVSRLNVHRVRVVTIDIDLLIVLQVVRVPERLRPVVAQPETVDARRETVDVVVWDHVGLQLEELILEHDLMAIRVEDDFAGARTLDAKLEAGVIAPGEREVALVLGAAVCNGWFRGEVRREDVERLVAWSQVLWPDADREALFRLILDR